MANVVSAGEAVARATAAGVARSTAAWLLEVPPLKVSPSCTL